MSNVPDKAKFTMHTLMMVVVISCVVALLVLLGMSMVSQIASQKKPSPQYLCQANSQIGTQVAICFKS